MIIIEFLLKGCSCKTGCNTMKCDAEENSGSVVNVHMPKKIMNVTEIHVAVKMKSLILKK